MKALLVHAALLTLVLVASGRAAAERLPAADFARSPEISNAKLSPDGQFILAKNLAPR